LPDRRHLLTFQHGSLVATLSVVDNATGSLQTVSLTGTGTTTAPGQTVSVVPSDNLQTLVNEYPASTTFSLAPECTVSSPSSRKMATHL
jgi:hypothetical protein